MQITADPPPLAGAFDKWVVERATTRTGTYSAINGATGQDITDLTYMDEDGGSTSWYRIRYYNSDTGKYSGYNAPVQGLSNTYTTPHKVMDLLQISTRSDTTNPSIQEIASIITRVEDWIDDVTGQAWRLRYSNTESADDNQPEYEYYTTDNHFEPGLGTPVYLSKRKIRTFDADEGDVIAIWDGGSWIDWLAKTEGRSSDYWVNYNAGIFYIRSIFTFSGPQNLRTKFRYGANSVPGGIQEIATKKVAIDVLSGMDPRSSTIQEESPGLNNNIIMSRWSKQINVILARYSDVRTIDATP